MLSPDQKGAIAELAVTHHAARFGVGVLRPLTDGHRYDVVFDVGGKLIRVQCKWASRRGDVVYVHTCSSRRTASGFVRRSYNGDEVDAIAVYCPDLDECYLLPPTIFSGHPAIQLRLAPTRNNQKRGITWAKDFVFAATLGTLGP